MHQAWLTIGTLLSLSGSTASGVLSTKSTVSASTLFTALMPLRVKLRCELGPSARAIENTTSSAVKAAPSWNLTPGRSRPVRHPQQRRSGLLGGSINDNFIATFEALPQLGTAQAYQLLRNSFEASFAGATEKAGWIARLDAAFAGAALP